MARTLTHWSEGLLIDLSSPSKWILHNDDIVVIGDKYPKAKFHYLVLPRDHIPSIFDVSRSMDSNLETNNFDKCFIVDERAFKPVE